MQLVTDRLTLRPPAARDTEAGVAFFMSPRSAMAGGHLPLFQAWKQFASILGHWEHRGYGLWAVTRTGSDDIIGLVGPFYPIGWPEKEFGWLMFDGSEGKGFAFEAARAALADTRDRLGWPPPVHYISPGNARSITLAQRLGARLDPDAPMPFPEKPCLVFRQPEVTR